MIENQGKTDQLEISSPFTQRAFIWAENTTGIKIAKPLMDFSIPVTLLDQESEKKSSSTQKGKGKKGLIETIYARNVIRIDGHFGHFRIWVNETDHGKKVFDAGCIFILADPARQEVYDDLFQGVVVPEANILSLVELEKLAKSKAKSKKGSSTAYGLFLDPGQGSPDRVRAQRALRAILILKRKGKGDFFILGHHMPLWGLKGQTLYDDLRKEGVRFFRLGPAQPKIEVKGKKVVVEVQDMTLPERPVTLILNRLIFIGQPVPPFSSAEIAGRLNESLDAEGFLQKENIHLYPSNGFRKGIYYLGSCKGEFDDGEIEEEVGAILPEVLRPLRDGSIKTREGIRINSGHCVSCLTCYRVCPHNALDISSPPTPVPIHAACQSCGLCQALCPGNAIELVSRSKDRLQAELESLSSGENASDLTLIFACTRACNALNNLSVNSETPLAIIEVPCACTINEEILLSAFLKGVKKVTVVGCHPDNCLSQQGTNAGEKRVQRVARYLDTSGLQSDQCLRFISIAPNEYHRASALLKEFLSA